LPENPYNTAPATGADFDALVSNNPFYLLPTIDKTSDAGQIGTGSHFATHLCNDYWSQPGVDLSTQIALFEIYGRIWLRAFGGTVADTVGSGGGHLHSAKMQSEADGSQLPGTSMIVENGTEKVLETGMVVGQATLSKTRRDRPTLSYSLVGTANHVNPHTLTGLPPYTSSAQCPKSGITVQYTDEAATVVDLGEQGCDFVDLAVALNNNLLIGDRCPSDPELTMPIAPPNGTANVVTRVQRQEQSLDIGFTFLLAAENPEYDRYLMNTPLTNLKIGVKGGKIGVTTDVFEIGVVVPKFYFRAVQATDNEGNASYGIAVEVIVQSVPADMPVGYVRNDITSNFK